MSAEHGSHSEETTLKSVLLSLIFGLLMIPEITKKAEEVVQSLTAPNAAGGHGGHH